MAVSRFSYFDSYLDISIPGEMLVEKMDITPVPPLENVYNGAIKAMEKP